VKISHGFIVIISVSPWQVEEGAEVNLGVEVQRRDG